MTKPDGRTIANSMNQALSKNNPLKGLQCIHRKPKAREEIQWYKTPKNTFNLDENGANKFNEVYKYIINLPGIKIKYAETQEQVREYTKQLNSAPLFCIIDNSVSSVVIICAGIGALLYQIGIRDVNGIQNTKTGKLQGFQAFAKFKKKCEEMGVDLEKYAVSKKEGLEIKEHIQKPYIFNTAICIPGQTYENVHHIDFHNSYPAGLVNTHPEFKEVVEYFYNNRKVDEINKAVLNYTIGYCQSGKIDYKYAQLSHDAINDNVKRLMLLANELAKSGRKVLLFNTDGVWYQGDVYHGKGEGAKLGEWENDHLNCKLRIKSAGSYEYIENDTYHPVVRGRTKLDVIKPREEWEWGDIFQNDAVELIKYEFEPKNGLTKTYEEVR